MDLAGRTILVTGGTSGAGLAIARQARRRGATVLVGSRTQDSYAAAVATIGGDQVHPFIADVGDAASLDRALDELERSALMPDDVVLCAASGLEPLLRPLLRATAALRRMPTGPERDAAAARYHDELAQLVAENSAAAFAVNAEGPRRLLSRLAPQLPGGARVILLSSLWSEGRRRGECPAFYSSIADSKNVFEDWLEGAAREWNGRVAAAVVIGHLISDTAMGRLINRNLLPLLPPDVLDPFVAGYVTIEQTANATVELLVRGFEPGALRRYYLIGSEQLTAQPDPRVMAAVGRMPL